MERTDRRGDGAIRLSDYRPPAWLVPVIALEFELDPRRTVVRATMDIERNPQAGDGPLVLDGHGQPVERIAIDGAELEPGAYRVDGSTLRILDPPPRLRLAIETFVDPQANTALTGLYLSNGNYCTQCEAEGFRRITWFPDRPDVLSVFTVTITADRERCPVMLSNGNLAERTDLGDGRHQVRWHDPHPKPSYLFALVAGDLGHVHDRFTTRSGREVELYVYAEHHNIDQCHFAMEALKKAMRWDEQVYGLEYDLDTYMIVAVDDFNMGAMENKGLNVFNSKYVLARPETATDHDYQAIEGVIAHEYFHNWSGNRVTCRDWFQLSLKEGFTVFRDQEFSTDVFSRVKRIDDVNILRTHQFPEDNGPLAHPVRPASYVEINNFYTLTVYNKGAEVVRMLRNLLGWSGFRAGCDLYFRRHDGQAVTTDDFVAAMEDANGVRLDRFRLWYSQAGTPRVQARGEYDGGARRYRLTLSQSCPPTPGQTDKEPFQIPVRTALFSAAGAKLATVLAEGAGDPAAEHVLDLSAAQRTFIFDEVDEAPIPSLLRGFSAPVMLDAGLDAARLAVLCRHDDDPFNRWDAGQLLACRQILATVDAIHVDRPPPLEPAFVEAFRATLTADLDDRSFQACALTLPDETYVAESMAVIEPVAVHRAREAVRRALAEACRDLLLHRYHELGGDGPYRFDAAEAGRRALRNRCLDFLVALGEEDMIALALRQFEGADNMTDSLAALACLAQTPDPRREQALTAFYERWRGYPLVVDKWFRLQATAALPGALARVRSLTGHRAYHKENPNRVRALVGAFCHGNPSQFHADDGSGYRFLGEQVLAMDPINPQVAARLVSAFNQWRRYDAGRQALMGAELERIRSRDGLSRDVTEIVGRTLAAG